jgi:ABC-type multidrug transport system permease subunit
VILKRIEKIRLKFADKFGLTLDQYFSDFIFGFISVNLHFKAQTIEDILQIDGVFVTAPSSTLLFEIYMIKNHSNASICVSTVVIFFACIFGWVKPSRTNQWCCWLGFSSK